MSHDYHDHYHIHRTTGVGHAHPHHEFEPHQYIYGGAYPDDTDAHPRPPGPPSDFCPPPVMDTELLFLLKQSVAEAEARKRDKK